MIKILVYFTYKYADAIVTNSTRSSNELSKKIGKKVITIFSPSYYFPKIKKVDKGYKKTKVFVTLSRLEKEKNIEFILKALAQIKEKNFRYYVIGDGNEKIKLKLLAQKLSIANKVNFISFNKNISKFLRKSDLYLNSSYFEGFPNAIIEALSHKVPVLATDSYGGIHDILMNQRYGFITKPGNQDSFVKHLRNFFVNSNIYLKKASNSQNHIKQFNLKNCVRNYENLIKKL